MNKTDIKIKLREGLNGMNPLPEKIAPKSIKTENQESDDEQTSKTQNTGGKKDYADVQTAFNKLGSPSMVDVMKITGTPDDEKGVNRSLFRKKVKQIKNKDSGSFYQFDDEELNQVRAALDIKK